MLCSLQGDTEMCGRCYRRHHRRRCLLHCHRSIGWRRWTAYSAPINPCVKHKISFSQTHRLLIPLFALKVQFDIVVCRSSFALCTHHTHRLQIEMPSRLRCMANKRAFLSNILCSVNYAQPNSVRIFIRFRSAFNVITCSLYARAVLLLSIFFLP